MPEINEKVLKGSQVRYFYDKTVAKALQNTNEVLSPITTKVNTLIGNDSSKSVRTIANEELAAALIPQNAQESLDTLQEIAAWIQSHPDDAADMAADIAALESAAATAITGTVNTSIIYDLKGNSFDLTNFVTVGSSSGSINVNGTEYNVEANPDVLTYDSSTGYIGNTDDSRILDITSIVTYDGSSNSIYLGNNSYNLNNFATHDNMSTIILGGASYDLSHMIGDNGDGTITINGNTYTMSNFLTSTDLDNYYSTSDSVATYDGEVLVLGSSSYNLANFVSGTNGYQLEMSDGTTYALNDFVTGTASEGIVTSLSWNGVTYALPSSSGNATPEGLTNAEIDALLADTPASE